MKEYVSVGREILHDLRHHGFEACFVGGYVRDFLLKIPLTDIDIATSATPTQVASLFEKTKNTGAKFGTVTVIREGFTFEVTTFRSDGAYADNRHPETVRFSTSLADDLIRRDFTVNALAMDESGKIIDLVNGIADLKTKTIRAIGDPDRRFQEDALRILRAFRFVAKLDFTIEPRTLDSIRANRMRLNHVSVERIMQELKSILSQPYAAKAFRKMAECQLQEPLFDLALAIDTLAKTARNPLNHFQFYALAFYLSGGDIPERWRFSNKERAIVSRIVDLCRVTEDDRFGPEIVYAYGLEVCLMANGIHRLLWPDSDQEAAIRALDAGLAIHKPCDLKYKGQDLLADTPIQDARVIGEVLSELILLVITEQLPNEYEALKAHAKAKMASLEAEGARNEP